MSGNETQTSSAVPGAGEAINALEALVAKWTERVWNTGELDLVKDCVAPTYARHDAPGDRVVTPESYAAEIAATREAIVGLHITNHLVSIDPPFIWVRWSITGTAKDTGQSSVITGVQVYRTEHGKLAETWAVVQTKRWPETPR